MLTFYGIVSFGAGILLWKKGICGILFPEKLSVLAEKKDRDLLFRGTWPARLCRCRYPGKAGGGRSHPVFAKALLRKGD